MYLIVIEIIQRKRLMKKSHFYALRNSKKHFFSLTQRETLQSVHIECGLDSHN